MKTITARLGNMRKAAHWVIYPEGYNPGGYFVIQSSTRMARINSKTGACLLSKHCPNGAYQKHLQIEAGATWIQISSDLMDEIISKQPKPGEALLIIKGHPIIVSVRRATVFIDLASNDRAIIVGYRVAEY